MLHEASPRTKALGYQAGWVEDIEKTLLYRYIRSRFFPFPPPKPHEEAHDKGGPSNPRNEQKPQFNCRVEHRWLPYIGIPSPWTEALEMDTDVMIGMEREAD